MKPEVSTKLIEINRQFYQQFAGDFDATRQRLQPGVLRVLEHVQPSERLLDLGCGNGSLRQAAIKAGHVGEYIGLDFSQELLAIAVRRTGGPKTTFLQRDLSDPEWAHGLEGLFDRVFGFAVFHHLPEAVFTQVLKQIKGLMAKGSSQLIFSTWQFLNSPRLAQRLLSWKEAGLDSLDDPEYLLDWRRGGRGLRYVHQYGPEALEALAIETGFRKVDHFFSDGKGGNLALYQVWEPA